ncbi:hypothetical protein ACO2Q0_03235 [Phenylobacterium sp. VNQ135]|uniref:hypothetical protein n=1 Tax=Phenylobacterium sp. VNQ135 TaxID=3400922 RepID=UPI003C002906
MGYAVGLIGLAAPMAAVAAIFRYTSRAERRRRQALFPSLHAPEQSAPPQQPVRLEDTDTFGAWQAGFSSQSESGESQKAADPPRPSRS